MGRHFIGPPRGVGSFAVNVYQCLGTVLMVGAWGVAKIWYVDIGRPSGERMIEAKLLDFISASWRGSGIIVNT